jgi:hypothetical protein
MKHLFICLIGLTLTFACRKDQDDRVPNVPVNITLLLNQPSNIALTTVGGWTYVTGGSKGIIVYRNGPEEFVALERHCPFDVEAGDRVFVNETNILAEDSLSCGSRFVITDGSIELGPTSLPLTRYQTTYNATPNVLRIFN